MGPGPLLKYYTCGSEQTKDRKLGSGIKRFNIVAMMSKSGILFRWNSAVLFVYYFSHCPSKERRTSFTHGFFRLWPVAKTGMKIS